MTTTAIVLIVFAVLLFLGVPLAFTMVGTSIVGFFLTSGLANVTFAVRILSTFDSFALLAIPLFMLAGVIMCEAGITQSILNFANAALGHFTGGLGYATTFTGVVMAGISGSANADSAAIGSVMVPAMTDNGYGEAYSVSLIATAGVLGPIIPPSIIMIIYAGCTGLSIAALFAAGILPGILIAGFMCVYNYVYAKRAHVPRLPKLPLREIWKNFVAAVPALLMPLIIIGGIISGYFTSTEAGAIAVAYGLVYALAIGHIKPRELFRYFCDSAISSAGPVFIMMASSATTYIFTRLNVATTITNWMIGLTNDYYLMLLLIILLVTILGMLIEVSSAMLMAVPIFVSLIPVFGYDPLYFAAIIVITFAAGGITPPVGIVLYIVAGIKNTPIRDCVKHILPFVFIILLVVILGVFIPDVFLLVPRMMGVWG